MDSQYYVLVAIVALAVVCLVTLLRTGTAHAARLTPLAAVAFGFVIAGVVFGEDRLLGYCLIGAGVALAIVDAIRRSGHRAA